MKALLHTWFANFHGELAKVLITIKCHTYMYFKDQCLNPPITDQLRHEVH